MKVHVPSSEGYVYPDRLPAGVAQARARSEHYERQADGNWLLRELQAGERLRLRSVDGEVAVDEVYRKVSLGAARG